MSSVDYEVVIVGGGPCGLLTALLLARRGVRCALLERRPELLAHPKAMGISRRTSEIFQQAGVRDAMHTVDLHTPEYSLAIWAESLTGEIYGRVPWPIDDPAVVPYPGFHCPQTTTERVLLDALEAESEASIFFDHEVTGLVESDEIVKLTAHREQQGQTLELTSRYVVAADGAGGQVRRWLGIESVGPGDLGHFLNVFFRANYGPHLKGRRAVLQQLLQKDGFEVFVTVNGDDLWLMHHFLQPGERHTDYPAERLAELVRKASGLPEVPVEIISVSPWVMSPKVASRFGEGRIFLTGDASARLSPAAGLGMNTGLQSAHNLAWKLAAVLHGAPATLLATYDTERRGHIMRTFETSNDFGTEVWDILNAAFGGDLARVRDLVSKSRRGGGGLGLDLGWTYEQGAFVSERSSPEALDIDVYVPTASPGRRAPHFWLESEGGRLSSLDLFGRGFALLVAGDARPWRTSVKPSARPAGFDLEIFAIGAEDGYGDVDGRFLELYGIGPGGAVLVRPDGVVGWRSVTSVPDELSDAIQSILAGI